MTLVGVVYSLQVNDVDDTNVFKCSKACGLVIGNLSESFGL